MKDMATIETVKTGSKFINGSDSNVWTKTGDFTATRVLDGLNKTFAPDVCIYPITGELNYNWLVNNNPTVFDTLTNDLGQLIELVEHPTKGDDSPIIAVCHDLSLAYYTPFFDTEDLTDLEGDYVPSFQQGTLWIGDWFA